MVLSDHGFTSFRYAVDLNRLLYELGFLVLKRGVNPADVENFAGVEWAKTQAYAIGLNSVFVNQRGREKYGRVDPGQPTAHVIDRLADVLTDYRDEDRDERPIREMIRVAERFPTADRRIAPDLLVGFAENYRVSWQTPLGGIADKVVSPNERQWSGDHCVASSVVPGVFFANRPLTPRPASLFDVAPTLLAAANVPAPDFMRGKNLLAT